MVPLPFQLHTTFSGHQNESNSHQKRQYGLGPLGGPNNGPPACKRGTHMTFSGHQNESNTLDSGIDVAPGITVAPPPKKFHITILILFYINLGIAIIFKCFFTSKFFKN